MATGEFELASFDGLPEFRVVMDHSGLLPTPMVQMRSTTLKALVWVERNQTIDEDLWKAIGECVMVAGAGAAVAGFIPGGVAAAPAFMQIFGTCATSKGLDLTASQFRFRTETSYGEWEPWTLVSKSATT